MAKIVECIPNFSEGRSAETIGKLIREAEHVPGVTLLDNSHDPDHNRIVLTLAGSPDGIAEAAFRLCRLASDLIDLTEHSGEHPRMGATDVIPFVPIREVTIDECIELSHRVAKRIYDELSIPVILYGDSASSELRRDLAVVRKGEFEGMTKKLWLDEWAPDYGERKVHPTAGVTAVGVRAPLIAFNVNLDTSNLKIANAIAKSIRGSSGGYKYCKAIGVMLKGRNTTQVSMNLVNYEETPIYRVFEAIRFEAQRWGVKIIGSELIGLAPAKALIDCAEYYLKIEDFDYARHVLENHLHFS